MTGVIRYEHISISFWIKQKRKSGVNPRIVPPYVFLRSEARKGIGTGAVMDPQPLKHGQWYHYLVTTDVGRKEVTIYRNGEQVARGNEPMTKFISSPWVIGHQLDLRNHIDTFSGVLDDLRIYRGLLTAADAREVRGGGFAGVHSTRDVGFGVAFPKDAKWHRIEFDRTKGKLSGLLVTGNHIKVAHKVGVVSGDFKLIIEVRGSGFAGFHSRKDIGFGVSFPRDKMWHRIEIARSNGKLTGLLDGKLVAVDFREATETFAGIPCINLKNTETASIRFFDLQTK